MSRDETHGSQSLKFDHADYDIIRNIRPNSDVIPNTLTTLMKITQTPLTGKTTQALASQVITGPSIHIEGTVCVPFYGAGNWRLDFMCMHAADTKKKQIVFVCAYVFTRDSLHLLLYI